MMSTQTAPLHDELSFQSQYSQLLSTLFHSEAAILKHLNSLHLALFFFNNEIGAITKQVKRMDKSLLIDPQECLQVQFQSLFDANRAIYEQLTDIDTIVAQCSVFSRIWKRGLLHLLRHRLRRAANRAGDLQILIREHDATASPLSGTGGFSDMDSLAHSLHS